MNLVPRLKSWHKTLQKKKKKCPKLAVMVFLIGSMNQSHKR